MNWIKLGLNVAAAIITAVAASGFLPADYATIAAAVGGNLLALFQVPPHKEE